jgi:hypothetical protein
MTSYLKHKIFRQVSTEESISLAWVFEWHARLRTRLVKSKAKSMLITFFDIKGIVHKLFVLAGQKVNSAYYCYVLRRLHRSVRTLHPELWQQMNWLSHHNNTPSHTSFLPGNFWPKTILPVPTLLTWLGPPQFCVSPIESPPFWHNCGDRGRIAGGAEHPHRIQLLGVI